MSLFNNQSNGLSPSHLSPKDGTATYTSPTSITVSSFPFVVDDDNALVLYIMYKPSGGDWQQPLYNGVNGISISASSNVVTVSGLTAPSTLFASGDTYFVGILENAQAVTEQAQPAYERNAEGAATSKDKILLTEYYDSKKYSKKLTVASEIIKDAIAGVGFFSITNESVDTMYFQWYNTSTALVSTTTTIDNASKDIEFIVLPGNTLTINSKDLPSGQLVFPDGLTFGVSSTTNVYTAVADPTKFHLVTLYE